MAQLTEPLFSINGDPLPLFSSFSLIQDIFEHHRFTLSCPAESIDGKWGLFTSSKDMIGASLGARVAAVGSPGVLMFNGVITGVETSRFTGHHGDVIITGYSPTIMLDSGPHCKSWEKKAVKNIANDVLKFFPRNLLQPRVAPVYGETLAYIVQYKETAWQFLKRLAGTYGEWLFYNGQQLIIGPPRAGKKEQLLYGRQLSEFSLGLGARPTKVQMMAWDYLNSQVYTSQPNGVPQRAGLNYWGEQVYQSGESVYNTLPKLWNNNFLTSKKQQDDLVTIRSALESSRLVHFQGKSGHPGVIPGAPVEVMGNNVFNGGEEGYGDYLVTAVSHFVDSMGNYHNEFTAVPASLKVPPVAVAPDPRCETQSAIVTDNHDYNGLGRIRVKFHWMNGAEKTPWIRVASPHGGGEKGHFFIPEIGEEVIVGFEGDSATKPYVIGTVYHGQANNAFSNAGNDVKVMQTRSGNKMVYNDKDGSITAEDACGNIVLLDGKGNIVITAASRNITVTAPETMTFNAKNMKINIEEDMQVMVGNNLSESVKKDYKRDALNSVEFVREKKKTTAGDKLETYGGEVLLHSSKGKILIDATDKLTLQSKNRIDYGE